MEVIMSTTFYTPATIRVRWRGSGLIATVQTWWMSYLTRRIERAAMIQLHGLSDRELQDIGLTRSQIEPAVRGELDHQPFARQAEPFVRRRSQLQHGASLFVGPFTTRLVALLRFSRKATQVKCR